MPAGLDQIDWASLGEHPQLAELPAAGRYDVYLYWPALADTTRRLARNAAVDVLHEEGRAAFVVDQRARPGRWHHLGTFAFAPGAEAYVEIRNDAADGVVLADAVRFCPVHPSDPLR